MTKVFKKHHVLGALMVVVAVAAFAGVVAWLAPHQAEVTGFTRNHPLLAPLIIITWKVAGIVFPPIPGGTLPFAMIPFIGWLPAFIYNTVGNLLGATAAFFIARRFREPVVARFVTLQELSAWEKNLSEGQEFWAFLLIRITTGPVFDVMSYVLGLSRVTYGRFLAISCLALVPDVLIYYLGGSIFKQLLRGSWFLAIGLTLALVAVLLLPHAVKRQRRITQNKQNKNAG